MAPPALHDHIQEPGASSSGTPAESPSIPESMEVEVAAGFRALDLESDGIRGRGANGTTAQTCNAASKSWPLSQGRKDPRLSAGDVHKGFIDVENCGLVIITDDGGFVESLRPKTVDNHISASSAIAEIQEELEALSLLSPCPNLESGFRIYFSGETTTGFQRVSFISGITTVNFGRRALVPGTAIFDFGETTRQTLGRAQRPPGRQATSPHTPPSSGSPSWIEELRSHGQGSTYLRKISNLVDLGICPVVVM
ncbi:uncharacterized protein FTJAE_2986 [Fusarium tjaetaba]|uniref:Uncharacterized protein n=1 Tax=Fusarium tjaetaba TaxID=1567544 RepID=A0A8H5RZU8_9HYPO|nr:uncharacterized protein FTJAE_2986 [Fusarium tjaetaba]KAF5643916.1 hypothetical protein FTJAE_2986 [Fusarium tjaetaba]